MAQDTGVKAFVSSAIASRDETEENERTTTIDGIEVVFTLPTLDQVVMSTAMIESATSNIEAGAALINIFYSLIKPEEIPIGLDGEEVDDDEDEATPRFTDYTARKLQAKMMDPHDDFGIEVIAAVMSWLLEEWSNRPTTPSSPSSSSPRVPGRTSRAKQRGGGSTRGTTAR